VDCWDLLGRIVGESEQGKENSLSEAVYERIYHEDPKVLSRKFLTGAKQFLEKQLRHPPFHAVELKPFITLNSMEWTDRSTYSTLPLPQIRPSDAGGG